MKIEETGAQTLRLAIDDIEYLHLFSGIKPYKAHERQLEVYISQMTEAMLAVNLREDFRGAFGYLQLHPLAIQRDNFPGAVFPRSDIESEGDRRAVFGLDVAPKIQAVMRVEASLIAALRILVENVSET